MGLEFLFSPATFLTFVGFLMLVMIALAMAFREGIGLLGWRRLLIGYLGVFVAAVAWTVISSGFQLEQLLSNVLLQSYFAFTWVTLFVAPLVLWQVPRGKHVLRAVMGVVCVLVCIIVLFVVSRVALSDDSILHSGTVRSVLVFGGWLLLMAYCFCFAAGVHRTLGEKRG